MAFPQQGPQVQGGQPLELALQGLQGWGLPLWELPQWEPLREAFLSRASRHLALALHLPSSL